MEITNTQAPVDRRPDALGDLRVLPDELLCSILESLTSRDVARLSCVSSVMYIFCNEEPLWMRLCLNAVNGPLQYKGSWKKTALFLENVPEECIERAGNPLRFDGFSSLFLYRRLYRCNTSLDGFGFDARNVERKGNLSVEDFSDQYDGKKPVLLIGLADSWPARTWTIDQLVEKYGDTAFRISQRSVRKVSMKFRDYVSYMELQRDEDPLYIFDDKFGEAAPSLVKDYSVPHLFQEDLFEILDREQRPPYRWLIIGPQRSGASWHVDPALTSAWNTLVCGRKRWALYPPGKVPLGVTVHVNEEDGDVNIETPSSLQWWLDFYPLLADEDKPIECTQLPGETIFVPSGWWHCVLNLETTIAVTQNFVNSKNFEYVCLDMAPGYRHKGVCRAGFLALDECSVHELKLNASYDNDAVDNEGLTRKQKRARIQVPGGDPKSGFTTNVLSNGFDSWKQEFSYDTKFLSTFLDEDRDHYSSPWSSGNCIGQREMRDWLSKLWIKKPGMRPLVWKGACFALNADKWFNSLLKICGFHNLPLPTDDQRLPVGTGSNPVYLLGDYAIKIFAEGGLEASMYGLGSELEFYSVLRKVDSPLKKHIPEVLFSGILYYECGILKILPWDGKGVPAVFSDCNMITRKCEDGFLFGVWGTKQFECRKAGTLDDNSGGNTRIWPYIITKRCKGEIFAHLRDELSWEDVINLATFLGEQLRNLHLLPYPRLNSSALLDIDHNTENSLSEDISTKKDIPAEWKLFIRALSKKRKTVSRRLINWGDPIPKALIQKVDDYIPDDFTKLIVTYQDEDCQKENFKPCSWIHSDIMDDNVQMEPYQVTSPLEGEATNASSADTYPQNGHDKNGTYKSWHPSHILDFSDLSIGDRLFDLIPIYLDIFRGDSGLLKQFLQSYRLPLGGNNAFGEKNKFGRLSYHAMCYCILHEENILGAIFSIWKELRAAKSWEEVELSVWGELNNYKGSS